LGINSECHATAFFGESLATVHAFEHTFDANGAAALFAFERLRFRQSHETATGRTWHKLVGTNSCDA
jgi:hypothetical protein